MLPTPATPFGFRHIILQPTTRCNLNCAYCYLPDRAQKSEMSVEIADSVAASLTDVTHEVRLLWHGGEPLSCGLKKFRQLLSSFQNLHTSGRLRHSLQTNATLITQDWCELFKEFNIDIGVSIDGSEQQNANRVTWSKRAAYPNILRGMELLHSYGIKFGIIAVVSARNIDDPEAFYEFFLNIGCTSLNINIEEREGLNQTAKDLEFQKVKNFWKRLFAAWRSQPTMGIREFDNALGWMDGICNSFEGPVERGPKDMWPTVAFNGDVVVVSPEFMSADADERNKFVIGNVLKTPLPEIVLKSGDAWYVREFLDGIHECSQSCAYYSYCGGGQASNKYFETGKLNVTETSHCKNTRQSVLDAVMESLVKTPHAVL
ncbi:MAG: uncharacterized protein QOG71_3862 [Pyrinomonadaceae bacterium]|nr:uncharacterized protein [Pyrinomonadaceae bacterium]